MEVENYSNFMDLPLEMIEHILSYLSYDQIAKLRSVNRTFNTVCSEMLNKGLRLVQKLHSECSKAVKAKLPRRESERRTHPLFKHSSALMSVETKLSLMSFTFSKFIDLGVCCFIPGKVLDETLRVLNIINHSVLCKSELARPFEFLQEFRDISSMSMEYFENYILPTLKEKLRDQYSPSCSYIDQPITSNVESDRRSGLICSSNKLLLSAVGGIQTRVKATHTSVIGLHRSVHSLTNKLKFQNIILNRKCNQQRSMIKLLQKELTSTRNTMAALAKEVTWLKSRRNSSTDVTVGTNNSSQDSSSSMKRLNKLICSSGQTKHDCSCKAVLSQIIKIKRKQKAQGKILKSQQSQRKLKSRHKKSEAHISKPETIASGSSLWAVPTGNGVVIKSNVFSGQLPTQAASSTNIVCTEDISDIPPHTQGASAADRSTGAEDTGIGRRLRPRPLRVTQYYGLCPGVGKKRKKNSDEDHTS